MNAYIAKIIEKGEGRRVEFNEIYSNLSEYPEGGLSGGLNEGLNEELNEGLGEGLTTQETTSKTTSKTNQKGGQTGGQKSGQKGGQIDIKCDSDIEFQSIFGESAVYFRSIFGVKIFKVLMIVAKNPEKTAQDIAEELSLSKRTIENYFAKLKAAKYIDRKGSDKTGCWIMIKKEEKR